MSPETPEQAYRQGNAAASEGQFAQAAAAYQSAVAMDPAHVKAWVNLGAALTRLEQPDDAVASYQQALRLAPTSVTVHRNLALALADAGRSAEALAHTAAAHVLTPDEEDEGFALWSALYEAGADHAADRLLDRLIQQHGLNARLATARGATASLREDRDTALEMNQKAAELDPADPTVLQNLMNALRNAGREEEAIPVADRLLALDLAPDQHALISLRRDLLSPVVWQSSAAIAEHRQQVLATLRASSAPPIALPLHAVQSSAAEPPTNWAYQADDNLALKLAHAERFASAFRRRPPVDRPILDGRRHVGIVIGTGHVGSFNKAMGRTIAGLDQTRLRVTVFCPKPSARSLTTLHGVAGIHIQHIPGQFDRAAKVLADAGLDVIYHWEVGTDCTNHFLPFLRLAPVQVTGWGWPDTSGAPHLDHHLSSAALVTPSAAAMFSETLTALPDLPARVERATDLPPPDRRGLPENRTLYVSAQTLHKMHPDMDPLFGGILRGDPKGLVVLVEDSGGLAADRLRQRLAQTIPDVADRVVMLSRMTPPEYHGLLAASHVALDPRPFGGALTAYDAVEAGLPTITWPTAHPKGRFTAALMRRVGADHCVVDSADDYVHAAVSIGTTLDLREELRQTMAQHDEQLFGRPEPAAQLSDFLSTVSATA